MGVRVGVCAHACMCVCGGGDLWVCVCMCVFEIESQLHTSIYLLWAAATVLRCAHKRIGNRIQVYTERSYMQFEYDSAKNVDFINVYESRD